jgi:hypothetical protein
LYQEALPHWAASAGGGRRLANAPNATKARPDANTRNLTATTQTLPFRKTQPHPVAASFGDRRVLTRKAGDFWGEMGPDYGLFSMFHKTR